MAYGKIAAFLISCFLLASFPLRAEPGFSIDGIEFDEESSGSGQEKRDRLKRAGSGTDIGKFLEKSRMRRNPARVVPSSWPVHGGISSVFGPRRSPFSGKWRFHAGMDIAAPAGRKVGSPAPGYVIFAGRDGEPTFLPAGAAISIPA